MVAIAGTMHSLPECIRGKAKRRSRNLWRRRFISPCAGRHYSPLTEKEPPTGTGTQSAGAGGLGRGLTVVGPGASERPETPSERLAAAWVRRVSPRYAEPLIAQ